MKGSDSTTSTDKDRRKMLALMLAGAAATGACSRELPQGDAQGPAGSSNSLHWAVAWKQTAAEYFALCHQAYNIAKLRVEQALAARQSGDQPLAVITDMDDTIMHARSYWGYLVRENREFFDDAIWDEWLPSNEVTAAPGALDFFNYCQSQGVEVFYVTNRDQGERTYEYAMRQLEVLNFPFADDAHLYVFRETSDKSSARIEIAESFNVAVMLGDNLNDYQRDYYVRDIDERMRLMERDRDHWGRDFVILPNPTDGHWVRAIFGESEPAATDENRAILKAAASRIAWPGP